MAARALLVGISKFDDPKLARLNSPQSDVEALAKVLEDPSSSVFESVTVSIDSDLLTIRDQLAALFDGRSADDMVLLYYSGHGIVAKGQRLYLATGQSSFDRPQARSIATNEIRDLMEQSRAGKLVVILDCCHSGVFTEGAKGADATAMNEATFGDADGSEGQYVLTATNALQFAYDGTGAVRETAPGPLLSRFTRWLVDGIGKGEASPFEEEITLDGLYQYLCRRARTEQAGMTPQRFVKRGSGDLVIARNPRAKPAALPAELVAKLDSTDWTVRRDAVAELGILAKQPRMGALAKKAVADRLSGERDVDVREAMLNLLQKLGPQPDPPPPDPEPGPDPRKDKRKRPEPEPPPPPPPPPPPALDDWQIKVVVKSSLATAALTGPNGPSLLMELQRRANGLRRATYMHRSYIAGAIFVGLGAIGQAADGQVDVAAVWLLVMIGFGIAGLFNRKTVAAGPNAPGDADMQRLQQAVPLLEARWGWGWGWSKREYEAKLYHRSCWWMVAGGAIAFPFVAAYS